MQIFLICELPFLISRGYFLTFRAYYKATAIFKVLNLILLSTYTLLNQVFTSFLLLRLWTALQFIRTVPEMCSSVSSSHRGRLDVSGWMVVHLLGSQILSTPPSPFCPLTLKLPWCRLGITFCQPRALCPRAFLEEIRSSLPAPFTWPPLVPCSFVSVSVDIW